MNPANISEIVKPNLSLLSEEQINNVHEFSIKILEETGIKVESKSALQIFAKSNAVKVKNDIVFIQREIIEHSIKFAPKTVDIYDKKGKVSFNLGNNNDTFFGIGVTNTNYQDIETNKIRPFTRKHQQNCTKLGDLLNNYDTVSTIGIPSDVSADKMDLYNTVDMYANTTKPLILLISEGENINKVFDLLSNLHGDISNKPFIIPYFNPITPLVFNEATSDKMIASINSNFPIIFSNYSMYGATSPITEGGSLALLNAELLAGLVFSQLIKEGSPIILGSLPASFNMTSMGSNYTTSSYLLNLACAEMMLFYSIPHCGTSGSGKAWGPDLIAAGEYWMNHITSCIGKAGLVPFVGGSFDSMAFSPASAVFSDFIIGETKKLSKGFILNTETVDLEEIKSIGHGGNYLTSNQTLQSLSNFGETNKIWPSLNMHSWEELGYPEAKKYLIDHSKELYNQAESLVKENIDVIKKGEEFINRL
ncbi:trimethylamine methyltransferase family protein [Bacteroidota bacterium]